MDMYVDMDMDVDVDVDVEVDVVMDVAVDVGVDLNMKNYMNMDKEMEVTIWHRYFKPFSHDVSPASWS
jgi:hypothetical protein